MGTERKRDFPQLPSVDLGRVDGMTVVEVDGGPRLELPEEPVDVKASLRDALLEGHDWREEFADDMCLAIWLWSLWQPALEPYGMSREDFFDQVIAFRRELWLWLIGDRQWLQYVTGLAGRVVRRLPAATQA
jgi:hypothetical protein